MRDDGAMSDEDPRGRLADDPRTVGIGGHPRTLKVLAPSAGQLWTLLAPDEPAVWAVMSFGPLQPIPLGLGRWARMKIEGQMWVVVRTPTRLIAMQSAIGPDEVAILSGPWRLELVPPSARDFGIGATVTGLNASMSLKVTDEELGHLQWARHCEDGFPPTGPAPQSPPKKTETTPQEAGQSSGGPETAVPGAGGWVWNRTVTSWQDAEQLAADHMRHLGFADVRLTGAGVDQGIDVLAAGAAAQVKFHNRPAGGPDLQQLAGAALGVPDRLFYATGFTDAATAAALTTGVALFAYEPVRGAVVPANAAARTLSPAHAGGDQRGPFGILTLDGRRTRALRWSQQIEDATHTPISNRKRKGLRQLEQRQQALSLVVEALSQLELSNSPINKKRRAERLVSESEAALRRAAKLVGVRLR